MSRLVFSYFIPKRCRSVGLAVLFALSFFVFVLFRRSFWVEINLGPTYDLLDIRLTRDQTGIQFCPVCFGRNDHVCEGILDSTIQLRIKKEKWTPRSQGSTWNGKKISIKHFRNATEFYRLDNELCSHIGKINTPCDVQVVVWKSFLHLLSLERAMKETMSCPSKRLVAKVKEFYTGHSAGDLSIMELASTLHVNQEPVIFQVFPARKGWPFPNFYGVCGRTVFIEDTGTPLDSFLSAPWKERAKLALEIIKIAKYLTNNPQQWGLYLAEIKLDMFAVKNGTVRLADANDILVVDFLDSSIKAETKKTVNECGDTEQDCLSFFPQELCQGTIRDHNFYAVCRRLLSSVGNKKGLLHTPNQEEEFEVLLENALTECVTAQTITREEGIDLIAGLLQRKISVTQG